MYDVIIIGGGAAGLFASANLPTSNALLLDHADRVGKKLLITGSGMCNLTNTLPIEPFLSHFGGKEQRNFLLPALHTLDTTKLYQWFETHGLPLTFREDVKVFPKSMDARDVRSVLIEHSRAGIRTGIQIQSIRKESEEFTVETSNDTYRCRNLIIATGGMSYPTTGSDGSGYQLAKLLGHTIIPPKPALVALTIESFPFANHAGNSIRDSFVTFTHPGEKEPYLKLQGDVLITHDGLSGPAILTASRSVQKGDGVAFSLISAFSHQQAAQNIEKAFLGPNRSINTVLKELGLTANLAQAIVEMAKLEKTTTTATLSKDCRKALVKLVSKFELPIAGTKGFKLAMVTSGGIALSQVNRKTMESHLADGLFFCGEMLDYDGQSGGYNLQAAFSTAYLATRNLH